eukprot:5679893-Prymnesium_polylepis.2
MQPRAVRANLLGEAIATCQQLRIHKHAKLQKSHAIGTWMLRGQSSSALHEDAAQLGIGDVRRECGVDFGFVQRGESSGLFHGAHEIV